MAKRILFPFFFIFIFQNLIVVDVHSQLDRSFLFVNYKKSLKSNFLNTEFQIGNSDEMHFLTVHIGYNFSKYSSTEFVPYHLGTVELNNFYSWEKYTSKKQGFQTGLGYTYYFINSENKKVIIPYFSLEAYWLHNKDNYTLSYSNALDQSVAEIPKTASFNTISCETHVGILYALDKIYFRGSATLSFFLPINTSVYMASDGYNAYSGFELPLAGLEPSLQLSIGLKLF